MGKNWKHREPPEPKRILIRGVNWLGDAIMTTPALQRLRERFPTACITLFTHSKLAELWTHHPAVDEVIGFQPNTGVFTATRQLKAARADVAVVLPNSFRTALEPWLAKIPRRIGFRTNGRGWLLTDAIPGRSERVSMHKRTPGEVMLRCKANTPRERWPSSAHQVHDYLQLGAALGARAEPVSTRIVVSKQEIQAAAQHFELTGPIPGAKPLFGLNPGAEYGPAKRWPAERFVEAALLSHQRLNCAWLVFGGGSDVRISGQIAAALRGKNVPVIDVSGQTTLRQLCALLSLCRGLLTNDTGPMHLAAALGIPVVALFGSTSPDLTGPGLPGEGRHQLLEGEAPCAPCFRRQCPIDLRCLKAIHPQEAARALSVAAQAG